MSEKMFETAAREKFRFPFKGAISTEDLWDLSVENLDSIYKTLNSQVKKVKEESLLATQSKEDATLTVMIEIVKYIVKVKLDEAAARLKARENREKRQKIMEKISAKQDADLDNKSVEELTAMLEELGN